jgi:hypothetical protein
MAVVSEVVVGATRKELRVTVVDEDGNATNITGGSVKLQGTSPDLPGKTIDVAGVIHDGPSGVAKWSSFGGTGFVSLSDLDSKTEATFALRVKFTDSGGLVDYGPEFSVTWKKPPV